MQKTIRTRRTTSNLGLGLISIIFTGVFAFIFIFLLQGCGKSDAQKWDSTEWTTWGAFSFDGLNETPMKEIAIDGYHYVEVQAKYEAKKDIYLLLEVVYENPDEKWPIARLSNLGTTGEVIVKAPIKKGSRFQVLTQAFQADQSYDPDYIVDQVELSYRITY